MSRSALSSLCAELAEILTHERDFLVAGRARDAVALVEAKTAALEQLQAWLDQNASEHIAVDERRRIDALVQIAMENASHFEAVRNGLRGAIDRLQSMHANAYVGSYSKDGSRIAFPQATGQYQKKG